MLRNALFSFHADRVHVAHEGLGLGNAQALTQLRSVTEAQLPAGSWLPSLEGPKPVAPRAS